jgi:4'-phosphopantetheinyl transferase
MDNKLASQTNESSRSAQSWGAPPEQVRASNNEVHIWRVSLKQSSLAGFLATLAPDECARAERFYFERDRNRFIVARGSLRAILGAYLRKHPARLSFNYSRYGKPALEGEMSGGLNFNLSHANELALIAVTRDRGIGIDIEFIRPDFASLETAERFFSTHEVATMQTLSREEQNAAFFNCWTRKEAYIKAIGEGMSMPLNEFNVSLAPGEPAALLGNLRDEHEVSRWSLRELFPGPGYLAAVAVEGHDWQLRCWDTSGTNFSL